MGPFVCSVESLPEAAASFGCRSARLPTSSACSEGSRRSLGTVKTRCTGCSRFQGRTSKHSMKSTTCSLRGVNIYIKAKHVKG